MMHSVLGVEEDAGARGWMHPVVSFAQPFRMPDFFLISGLFLGLVIDRPWLRYADRKIIHFASRLTRTYTDRHGLKEICSELLDINLSKQQQSSDWAAPELSQAQLEYAASDVLYLHRLSAILIERLKRDGRAEEAAACFQFLPTRAKLDLMGWEEQDIFAHS
jgi:hypothetical protein